MAKKVAQEDITVKVYLEPRYDDKDNGEGGIRRVVEAQKKYLPQFGCEIVQHIEQADMVACHGGTWVDTKLPTVMHCHGLYWKEYDWEPWAHELNKHVIENMRRADRVTAPSKWVQYALQRGMMIDAPVLYHGVDADEWTRLDIENNEPYVLWNKTRVDAVCDPEPLNRLAELARDVQFITTFGNDTGNVTVTGKLPIHQGKALVQAAAVYLCTTRETFGIGTLEAMACEVPILGWAWGGQVEFVEHKVHGYLARPGDYEDLLRGLRYCLEHRERLGKAARKSVARNFTWPAIMQNYALLYKNLVRQKAREALAPKVSVVITCYNLAPVLPRAVESVLTQEDVDQNEVEIVIVNDNSPDDTAEVAADLAARYSNVKVVTNEKNLYLAGALNAGIAASRGRYIVPLDADNELGPRALSVLGNVLDRDRSVHIVYGAMEVVDEATGKRFISGWPGEFNYAMQMQHRNQIPSTSMYRREIWERTGGYRRRCRTAEDADFWCRVTSFGAVPRRVTDAVTLIYHDRSDSMSHTEKDWDWPAWYAWSRDLKLAPFSAAHDAGVRASVCSYQPSLVTVVIPVGPGHEQYVVDAVDSLLAQSYENWYCIVVNDSGTELPRLPSYVRVINTRGGTGPAAARNAGIKECVTPLFLLLDADDYLHPDALSVMLRFWKPGSKEYYYSDWYVQETQELKTTPEFDCELMRERLIHSVTGLYPLEAWKAVKGFDEKLDSWEDWDFALNLIDEGYCGVRVPYGLFYYRMQAGSRREEMYAKREQALEAIRQKWPELEDRSKPMACGCQKAGPLPQNNITTLEGMQAASMANAGSNDVMVVEFIGEGGARTYRGPSGTEYRFGASEGDRVKYVRMIDVPKFKERPEFSVRPLDENAVIITDRQLVAPGPPVR